MDRLDTRIEFHQSDPDTVAAFVEELKISPLTARILYHRGIRSLAEASLFLSGNLGDLHPPFLMKDMGKAVERIRQALAAGETIAIFGDYDVDGTSGTALLYRILTRLGGRVLCSIPDRIDEGYGLSCRAIDRARADGALLAISVDCGISNLAEVAHARSLGMDVIITDHHETPAELPAALAILNPKQGDCPYPFKMLSGVGVAFKLASALEESGFEVTANDYLDLAALGTIADITPLINENRIIARYGLERMRRPCNLGIRALLELTHCTEGEVTPTHVGYQLAPRINASGRIGDASNSLRLLLAETPDEAAHYARILDEDNRRRQAIEQEIMADVEEELQRRRRDYCITLASDRWHAGIIGVVASKVKERHYRPTVLIAIDNNRTCRGSARSIHGFSLIDALTDLEPMLIQYGGHQLAAGFSIEFDKIDSFRRELNRLVQERVPEKDLHPLIRVDAELPFPEITNELIDELQQLGPFGHGNPKPLFLTRDVSIQEHRRVGRRANHLLFKARKGSRLMEGIGFSLGEYHERLISPAQSVDLVYELSRSVFHQRKRIQLKLKEIKLGRGQLFEDETDRVREQAESLRRQGNECYASGDFDRALALYRQALDVKFDEAEVHFNMGLAWKHLGQLMRSLEAFGLARRFAGGTERGRQIRDKCDRLMSRLEAGRSEGE